MATPSSAVWATPDDLDPDGNEIHARIHAILSTANFEHLQKAALLARNTQKEHVACAIDPKSFTYGMNNLVLKVAFSDGVDWIARVHHVPVNRSNSREHAIDMLSEVATLKTLKSRSSIPVPRVYGFDTSPNNPFGFPYIFMECLRGRVLSSTIARQVPIAYHQKVAGQLADVLFQLENLTFDKLGRIWCGENCDEAPRIIASDQDVEPTVIVPKKTSLEWFYELRQDQNRAALEGHAHDPEWRTSCWILKTAISHFVIEDRLHGPFPLCHFDLHYGNLLFDDEYTLTGVLDWSQAETAPLERLAVSPEFITFPLLAPDKNQLIIDFRNATRDALHELEKRMESSPSAAKQSTALSTILGSRQAEITHRCTYSRPHRALFDGKLVSKLIYGDHVSWEQLVAVYGAVALH
ncbi:kinase-like domain-containing protein [Durotheca rogersii]|uniref:kinase-like domain-containing protein n=1 Tax=Durotheca rogersii TaxID=419775 RepID=UPI00221E643D|nr:kinase-like domain-containing protein [Durotheca rogersii]KAI5859873.1 kinase-like domain-containing protein [Durotheca rogersii]